jgi:hydrogenase expression/formation protein HypE
MKMPALLSTQRSALDTGQDGEGVERVADSLDFEGWSCPLPLRDYPHIILGHGGGGKLSAELIQHLFVPAFANATLAGLGDAAVLEAGGTRLAVSTDSFVVHPLFFPGGNIGELAVHGTVNDVAMSGARPLYLTAGFIIEEGFPLDRLGIIVQSMAAAARAAGVQLVAGDTKVVDRGHGDGVFINTTGVGLLAADVHIAPDRARTGDVVILSGTIGDHGMAIMSVREGLEFDTVIKSDTAALNGLVARMLEVTKEIHVLRDPTRGGVASSLNEIAEAAQVGITLNEEAIPVNPAVHSACELLGMDPLYVANEGKLLAFVPAAVGDAVLAAMREHPLGKQAAVIGRVVADHPGLLVARTAIGGTRVVSMQVGEQLPRIC